MDLEVVWTQGTCNGDAYFVSNNEICYKTGSFLKISATDNFSESSIQEPLENAECICADPEMKLISVVNTNICVLNYPSLEILNKWAFDKKSQVIQTCFAGNQYLLTLEGSPYFTLTLWNWKNSDKLAIFEHRFPIEDVSSCFLSVHPTSTNLLVFQHYDALHFYEIEDICPTISFTKNTLYLPLVDDLVCNTILHEKIINDLTYFDKMQYDAWGIHSEMLHSLPIKSFCSALSERELVRFYDFLMKQERLQASSHCWLPDRQLLVACFTGTILLVALDFTTKIIHSLEEPSKYNIYVTCMALNKNGLYIADNNDDISFVQCFDKWTLTKLTSIQDSPLRMKFSPDFKNLLIVNRSCSIASLDTTSPKNNIVYLSTNEDDSRLVGIFVADEIYCITARASGLIEKWTIRTGIPLFQYHMYEHLQLMEGCPSSSVLIISGVNTYIYIIDVSEIKDMRIVHVFRPCESIIKVIKCDNFGRFSLLISEDKLLFICSLFPSTNFEILGYLSLQYDVEDLALFSKNSDDATFVSVLRKGESVDYLISLEIPKDFDSDPCKYWEDESARVKPSSLKQTEINLGTKCSSVVSHLLNGLILHRLLSNDFTNIPHEDIRKFKPSDEVIPTISDKSYEKYRMYLSPSHYMLLMISESGNLCIRKTHNFEIIYKQKIDRHFPIPLRCAFAKNLVLIEACNGVLVCLKLSKIQDMGDMSWISHCKKKKVEENKILSKMKSFSKSELTSWIIQRLNVLNQSAISELKLKRCELENKFKEVETKLKNLVNANFELPLEHQIESEELILDKNIKEQLIKSRNDTIENNKTKLKDKLENLEKKIIDIKEECIDKMFQKSKFLLPFRTGVPLYNYSIPFISDHEKAQICYTLKKLQLENYLKELKTSESAEIKDFDKDLLFQKATEKMEGDIIEDIKKHPFHLQSREEKIDYTFILKYVIFRKRLAFNNHFNEAEILRKDTAEKIKENNQRIKEIMLQTKEEEPIWEPPDLANFNRFQVTEEEIRYAKSNASENDSVAHIGIAEGFLKNEWLLKLKATLIQKRQVQLKKGNIDLLKKEVEKKLKAIDSLVDDYDKVHNRLAENKLICDIDINQDELQLCLILFSLANVSLYKKFEEYHEKSIEGLESKVNDIGTQLREADNLIPEFIKEIKNLTKQSDFLDTEIKRISKISRNKQAFLEAYEERPAILEDSKSLNPYKELNMLPVDMFLELNTIKNKPLKVPLALWKQLCSLREQKFSLEREIDERKRQVDNIKKYIKNMKTDQNLAETDILLKKENLQKIHEMRIRCGYETPVVLSISDPQLELKYPDSLDFKEALFLRKFHVQGLNGLITNVGNKKLKIVQNIAKTCYQTEKNKAKARLDSLKIRDAKKEIELVKSIPLTKDVQKIIQDPKGFRIQDKIDAFEKSKQMEMNEIGKQMAQVSKRISSIEQKKDILRKSMNEKRKDIKKLKGDIAELRKIENLKKNHR